MLFILLLFGLIQCDEFSDDKNQLKNDHNNINKNDENQNINSNKNLEENSLLIKKIGSNANKNATSKQLYNRFSRENQRKSILFKRTKSRNGKPRSEINDTKPLQQHQKVIRRPILSEVHKKTNITSKHFNKDKQINKNFDKNSDYNKNAEKIRAGFEILKMKDQMKGQNANNDNGEAQRKKIAGILDFIKEKYAPSRTPVPQISIGLILLFSLIGTLCLVVIYFLCCQSYKKFLPKKINEEEMPFKMANFNQEEKELAAHGFSHL